MYVNLTDNVLPEIYQYVFYFSTSCKSYMFGTTRGWVNDDRISIVEWKTALCVLLLKKVVPECTVMTYKTEKFKIADEVGEIFIMNKVIFHSLPKSIGTPLV